MCFTFQLILCIKYPLTPKSRIREQARTACHLIRLIISLNEKPSDERRFYTTVHRKSQERRDCPAALGTLRRFEPIMKGFCLFPSGG